MKMHRPTPVLAATAALLLATQAPAAARDLFSGTFTVDGQTTTAGTSNASDFANLFTDAGLNSLFSTYTTNSAAVADVSLRGVPATISYNANSATLRLVIPSIGVDESFAGATRDQSQDMALDWLKGGGGSAMTRFLQQAVASTPVDPMAGNPNSLMNQMGAADFGAALGGAGGTGSSFGATGTGSRFGAMARFGSYSASGYDTTVWSLPLGYEYGFSNGMELVVDAPITLVETSGAQSYSGSVGLGLRIPIALPWESVKWSLTPVLRGGGVGSVDAGAVGGMWSGSVTSVLDLRVDEASTATIGNMVSRLQTLPIDVAGYNVSYELTNFMFRNGLIYTRRLTEWGGRQVSGSVFVVDTRFTGDALYVNSYQEYGAYLSLGDPIRQPGQPTPMRVGFTFLNGDNGYQGFSLNFGISF
jgi:hypothetical protein